MNTPEKSALNKQIILRLDTSLRQSVLELLKQDGTIISKQIISDNEVLSSVLLISVDKMLKSANCERSEICGIVVQPGPGSYTGLRIGLTSANFIAYVLNVPIFSEETNNISQLIKDGKIFKEKFSFPVVPVYGNAPHITKAKSRL